MGGPRGKEAFGPPGWSRLWRGALGGTVRPNSRGVRSRIDINQELVGRPVPLMRKNTASSDTYVHLHEQGAALNRMRDGNGVPFSFLRKEPPLQVEERDGEGDRARAWLPTAGLAVRAD